MKIAILTSEELPLLTDDDRPLIDELASLGAAASPLVWTQDSGEDFDAILVRSPWDYHLNPERFFSWFDERVERGTLFENAADLLKWNSHKFYLMELAGAGLPVLETVGVVKGSGLTDARSRLSSGRDRFVVVKPAVSASAFETRVIDIEDSPAIDWANQLAARCDVLLQPFVETIAHQGELSIVAINGEVTHVYLKHPKNGDFRVQEEFGGQFQPVPVEAWHQTWARDFLSAARQGSGVHEDPLYARIDLLPGPEEGSWVLGELELFEPALKFELSPESMKMLCKELVRRVRSR